MLRLVLSRAYFWLLPLALASTSALAVSTTATPQVWVITDRWHDVLGESDQLIELDAPARIEAELSKRLPKEPWEAQAQVQRRLQADAHRRLVQAYQDVAEAWRLGVAKIPAVVVDRRYVVYGETDVTRAVARVEQWRRAQP